MTKPNELTLEKAIERVERIQKRQQLRAESIAPGGCQIFDADTDLTPQLHAEHEANAAALRLVIEAAKRPTALSGEEREEIAELLDNAEYDLGEVREQADCRKHSDAVRSFENRVRALRSALSLASPFTREEWDDICSAITAAHSEFCVSSDGCNCYDLADKLSAYIESRLPAQSSPANRELDGVDAPADNSGLHRP